MRSLTAEHDEAFGVDAPEDVAQAADFGRCELQKLAATPLLKCD
ncbi:hypothetical protein [Bosea psychrotolerans]|nr:hypothetical protein [Bosea psychrotolerans]